MRHYSRHITPCSRYSECCISFDEGQRMIKVLSTPPSGEQSLLSSHAAHWSSKNPNWPKRRGTNPTFVRLSCICESIMYLRLKREILKRKVTKEVKSAQHWSRNWDWMTLAFVSKAFHVELKCQCGHDSIILLVPFVSNRALIALWRSITCFRRVGACCATI